MPPLVSVFSFFSSIHCSLASVLTTPQNISKILASDLFSLLRGHFLDSYEPPRWHLTLLFISSLANYSTVVQLKYPFFQDDFQDSSKSGKILPSICIYIMAHTRYLFSPSFFWFQVTNLFYGLRKWRIYYCKSEWHLGSKSRKCRQALWGLKTGRDNCRNQGNLSWMHFVPRSQIATASFCVLAPLFSPLQTSFPCLLASISLLWVDTFPVPVLYSRAEGTSGGDMASGLHRVCAVGCLQRRGVMSWAGALIDVHFSAHLTIWWMTKQLSPSILSFSYAI